MTSRIHLTEEEVYDIFRNVFHNEEDALAATRQGYRGDPISWDTDYKLVIREYRKHLDIEN
jgi:hypothetical protein